LQVEDGTSD